MKLSATTLVGTGRASESCGALQSASCLVDEFIVIDTAPIEDPIIRFYGVSPVPEVHRFPWPGRFDVARNETLRLAAASGCDWSVFLDSDERIVCPDTDAVRAYLAALDPKVMIVCAHSADGTYQRERFFRGSIPQRWKFRTHESIDAAPGEQAVIPPELITWAELPKTGEQVIAKSKRDVEMIREDLKEFPDEPRLWFYLGNSLAHIGAEHYEEAIAAYKRVSEVGIGEGCAWACFCAARIYFQMSQGMSIKLAAESDDALSAPLRAEMWRLAYKALDCCSAGIHRETRVAELHWLAACVHHAIGNHEIGQAYARQAKLHGIDSPSYKIRHGFMVPHALRDGPDVVERMCIASIAAGLVPMTNAATGDSYTFKRVPEMPMPSRIEYVRGPVHITVTSTALHAKEFAGKCIRSVREQTFKQWDMHYVACDYDTAHTALSATYNDPRINVHEPLNKPPLLANLLPIWRALPPEEVIVWIDGDDWLATDLALALVAGSHSRGMMVTYGSFMFADGAIGFAAPAAPDPRMGPWFTTHLKTFRAGLVQRVREADWHYNDGSYLDLAIDRAVMLPCLEMAGPERSEYISEILYCYNQDHGYFANADDAGRQREMAATQLVHGRQRYSRIGEL